MNITFLDPNSKTWNKVWKAVASVNMNRTQKEPAICEHPESGECWQYMGSTPGYHDFRHRCHPVTNKRVLIRVPLVGDLIEIVEA